MAKILFLKKSWDICVFFYSLTCENGQLIIDYMYVQNNRKEFL